ncbi:MAG TPA: Asd/ArgC dimerization domain-containing protein [Bryobacteraceae bacterium]|nr:Asd/ArgC dimerization domain-containing protein [Bryobacteraceae bacterium]
MAETIALVGGETLLGREVRDVLGETPLGGQLRLVASGEEEAGTLTEVGGEPAFLSKLEPEAVEDAAVVILAGSAESSKAAIEANPTGVIIDLTYATEHDPAARIRAPQAEDADYEADRAGPHIVAHPAATAIAMVLKRLDANYPITRAVVHIFQPASEYGTPGIEELQQQTVNLLALQPLPKKVFDTQLGYALLAQFGLDAPAPLAEMEERIERHLASLLERMDGVPMPSLRLIQAPVFHGYSFSFWIEFDEAPTASDIEETMSQADFDVRGGEMESPNNVGVAGQSGIAVGAIAPDRNSANAFWIWAAADNLRLAAESAALIAEEVL